MSNRTNIVLAVMLVVVVILTAMTRVDYARPNIEILPDMKYTPAWTTYSPNPNFRNGRTLQAPVPGTIARGQMPLYFEATKEDAVRAGEELQNPYAVNDDASSALPPGDGVKAIAENQPGSNGQQAQLDAAEANLQQSVQRGGNVYRVFCISCHGPTGTGDGPVPKRGFPPPPSLLTGNSLNMKDGQLFHILTYGQGSMSDLAAQLSSEDRWDVINYVRSLQKNAVATASSETPEDESVQDKVEKQEVSDPTTNSNS